MYYVCYALFYIALAVGIYFLWSRRRYYRVAWQLPGPLGLPFIGLGLDMMNPETFLQYMQKISESYKSPFISWMGTKCFLYVNDPETIETIFNSSQCTNKGDFYRFMAAAIGDGLFTSSSPRWNKHRRLINPAFSRQVINNFMPIFNAESDALLLKFSHACQENDTTYLEIYPLIKKSVLEAACQTTMGKKMNFQNDGSALIFDSYNGLTEVCVKRMLSPWLYSDFSYRHSPLYSRERKVVQVLFDFVENLLLRDGGNNNNNNNKSSSNDNSTKTVGDTNNTKNKNPEKSSAVEVDKNCTGINGGKSKAIFIEQVRNHIERGLLSWEDVRDEANVIIAATFETTSTALYLVCLCLAMHPHYQEKLYEELLLVFPASNRNSNNDGDTIGDDDMHELYHEVRVEQLEQLSYTEMVINEAMRLFAPVPMVLRTAASDLTLSNGIVIPCGTQIGIDIFNMQRSTHVWGADALCFRPERQLQPPPHPFAYVPFTKGLRMCIGYRYALMLMKVMLAKIFRNYMLRTAARLDDLVIKGTISLKLRDYPLFEVIPRQHQRQNNFKKH